MKLEYLSQEQCLKEYIKIATSINPTLSIEVGAHEAEYSNAMSIRGIRSIAFEASPAVYKKYKNYINNFEYINLAITNYAGSIFFNLDSAYNPSDIGHNSIKDFNLHWRSNGDPIKVSCSSLDLYFNNLQDEKICLWVARFKHTYVLIFHLTRSYGLAFIIFSRIMQKNYMCSN